MARDVRGTWNIHQSNGFTVTVQVDDEDADGSFTGNGDIGGGAQNITLTDTRATDNEFTMQMGRGRYVGRFDFQGRLTGQTFDVQAPHSQANWHSDPKLFGFM
jgi:hypothetical protein